MGVGPFGPSEERCSGVLSGPLTGGLVYTSGGTLRRRPAAKLSNGECPRRLAEGFLPLRFGRGSCAALPFARPPVRRTLSVLIPLESVRRRRAKGGMRMDSAAERDLLVLRHPGVYLRPLSARPRAGRLGLGGSPQQAAALGAELGLPRDQVRRALAVAATRGDGGEPRRGRAAARRGAGGRLITRLDAAYPAATSRWRRRCSLSAAPQSPSAGRRSPSSARGRRASMALSQAAELFARGLAAAGITAGPGFARGIDAAAHRGASPAAARPSPSSAAAWGSTIRAAMRGSARGGGGRPGLGVRLRHAAGTSRCATASSRRSPPAPWWSRRRRGRDRWAARHALDIGREVAPGASSIRAPPVPTP